MTSTTEPQSKRSEEPSVTEIEELLKDAWEKVPLEVKKLITLGPTEPAVLLEWLHALSQREPTGDDSPNDHDL